MRSREAWIAAGNTFLGFAFLGAVAFVEVLVLNGIPGARPGPVLVFGLPLLVGGIVWTAGRARSEPLAPWFWAGFLGAWTLLAGSAWLLGPR